MVIDSGDGEQTKSNSSKQEHNGNQFHNPYFKYPHLLKGPVLLKSRDFGPGEMETHMLK